MASGLVLSMTGFGTGEADSPVGLLRVELRAVNHRHLDVRVRAPAELMDLSHVVEDVIRAQVIRGRIEAQVRLEAKAGTGKQLDLSRAKHVYEQLRALRDQLAPDEPLPLTAVLSAPGVLTAETRIEGEGLEAALSAATQQACADLQAMRAREGAALSSDLRMRLGWLAEHQRRIAAHRPVMLDAARQRLHRRVEKLLEGTGIEVDPGRVAQEIVWFAERSDIAEELTRFASHLSQFERSLDQAQGSIGKKLDFLVQELGREVNTMGAKANDATISHTVVEMKAELERIREQVQNLL
jgi:uncharacterized protein (TIGR00255 family)